MFHGIKDALQRVAGLAEHDAELVAKAVHDDLVPLLNQLRADLVRDLAGVLANSVDKAS